MRDKKLSRSELLGVLSPEFRTALKIYELTEIEPYEIAYFSRLVELLKGGVSKAMVGRGLENLSDAGMIKADWGVKGTRGVRVFLIAPEAKQTFKELYDYVQRCENG
jgi:hypothetical protein